VSTHYTSGPVGGYDPVTGTGYTAEAAREAWGRSMETANRKRPVWQLGRMGGGWMWTWYDFRAWWGTVEIKDDGFHWETRWDGSNRTARQGVTTSLTEAYRSVTEKQTSQGIIDSRQALH
jgi:hypothetical protein